MKRLLKNLYFYVLYVIAISVRNCRGWMAQAYSTAQLWATMFSTASPNTRLPGRPKGVVIVNAKPHWREILTP